MPYGRPPIRRRISRHGFTSPGYVENLPVRKEVPVDWKKMRERYIPGTIMNFILPHLFGYKTAMAGLMGTPALLGLKEPYDFTKGR